MHAFVPLVSDERLSSSSIPTTKSKIEDRHADLFRTMRGLPKDPEDYPPIFAVVMRRPGLARLLECHAFACQCEADAVAAAATLYRALLADLDANARRPRQRNGLGCVSLASVVSSARDTSSVRCPAGDYCSKIIEKSNLPSSSPEELKPVIFFKKYHTIPILMYKTKSYNIFYQKRFVHQDLKRIP